MKAAWAQAFKVHLEGADRPLLICFAVTKTAYAGKGKH
jgi:hypothetical protein